MRGLIKFTEAFPGPVQAGFDHGDTGTRNFRHFHLTAAFFRQGEQGAVLGTELSQGMPQRIEFLRVHRAGRLGDILVLGAKGQENAPQFLPAELVDAGIARQPEKPGLELRGFLQSVDRPDHFDENLLRQVFHIIAPRCHGVDKPRHPMLVVDNDLPERDFVALLRSADKIRQRGR